MRKPESVAEIGNVESVIRILQTQGFNISVKNGSGPEVFLSVQGLGAENADFSKVRKTQGFVDLADGDAFGLYHDAFKEAYAWLRDAHRDATRTSENSRAMSF